MKPIPVGGEGEKGESGNGTAALKGGQEIIEEWAWKK